MKKNAFVLISVIFTWNVLFARETISNVVPQPQEVTFTKKNFKIKNQTISLKLFCDSYEPLKIALKDLEKTAKQFCNAELNDSKAGLNIFIGIPKQKEDFNHILKQNDLLVNDSLGQEGYRLLIESKKIIIAANDQKGLFYGIQTLKQIIRGALYKNNLPGLKITDWPSFKYRAIFDDISRGPLPTMDYMKYQVRRLAEMKINTIIQYVEHVVKTKRYPEFAPDDGSLTIKEWKEIADYAIKYNITIIGGFQSFGHFQNILKTPEYAHLGESGSLISPVLPESYEFLENIYNEMIPAFHSDIFNVNCDETFDLGKGASKTLVDSLGYAEVYYRHMIKLYNILKRHNKRMLMWGDIIMQYPELLDKLPKDILIGTWNYDARETFKEFIDPFENSGFEFWVVPGVLNSRRIYPDFDKAFKNIKVFVKEGFEAGATGVLNCFWDDGSTAFFSNDWYGAAYGADKSWNPKSDDNSFDMRYGNSLLGTNSTNLMKAIRKLDELRFLELTDGMTDKIMFAKIVPDSGKHIKISVADLDTARVIIDQSEALLKQADLKLYTDDVLYLQFIIELYRALVRERFELLDAAQYYAEAETIIINDPVKARNLIVKSLELISKIIIRQRKLKTEFEILWLKENHTYALDWITDKYDKKIHDFVSIRNLLLKSLQNFDSSKPILSKENVRLAVTELPGKYFTEWMMPNPIINKDKSPLSIDYLRDMGGESAANPKVTQEFYFEGQKYRWRRVVSEYADIVNLGEIFPDENADKVIYAFANISCDKDMPVKAAIGCDEGVKVFINGKSVFEKTASGKMIPDEFQFDLPLNEGKNNLLIKLSQTSGEWAFTFRLIDKKVRNNKNRYKIVD